MQKPPGGSGGILRTGPNVVSKDKGAGGDAVTTPKPLPERMRPQTLGDFLGQEHLVGKGRILYEAIDRRRLFSVVFYGPPGTGKTALAHILAKECGYRLWTVSATSTGVKELREKAALAMSEPTVLFIDEVHRLSRTQQDVLLPFMEQGTIVVGATTENPYISLSPALLSRSRVMPFEPLDASALDTLLKNALLILSQDGAPLALTEDAQKHLITNSQGDARQLLSSVELASAHARCEKGRRHVGKEEAEEAVGRLLVHDAGGDAHYDVTSAFIKSMRGSDPDAALHYLGRMLLAGEDPRYIARRIIIHASEDVGMADPRALEIAVAAAAAVERIGLPEGRICLAQAVIYNALAPKSNSVITAIDSAMAAIKKGHTGPVPPHLRDTSYRGAASLGHGRGYLYPHDHPQGMVRQQYLPDSLADDLYYHPSQEGLEQRARGRLETLRRRQKPKR